MATSGDKESFSFTVQDPNPKVLEVRRKGEEISEAKSITFRPQTITGKFYGSPNDGQNKARQIIKAYCSPKGGNNTAKKIKKIYYGTKDNKAVEIFRDI